MRFLVDNSEYPRYGKDFPPYDIGNIRKKGTKKCWLIQGHVMRGCGINFFTEIRMLQMHKYRCVDIPSSIKWIKYQDWKISYSLMDREFYRASLISDLQKEHLPVLIPVKKFPRVKKIIREYLFFNGPLVSNYWFKQKSGAKTIRKRLKLRLVLIGHKHVGAWQIRKDYKNGKIGYDEAISKISGFLTTLPPRKNLKRWSIWLSKIYKHRWNIETGFSKINEIHEKFRCRSPTVFLAFMYMRAMIYNWWQAYRKVMSDHGYRKHDLTLLDFKKNLSHFLKNQIYRTTRQNIKYGLKQKRSVYFM